MFDKLHIYQKIGVKNEYCSSTKFSLSYRGDNISQEFTCCGTEAPLNSEPIHSTSRAKVSWVDIG